MKKRIIISSLIICFVLTTLFINYSITENKTYSVKTKIASHVHENEWQLEDFVIKNIGSDNIEGIQSVEQGPYLFFINTKKESLGCVSVINNNDSWNKLIRNGKSNSDSNNYNFKESSDDKNKAKFMAYYNGRIVVITYEDESLLDNIEISRVNSI